jgi:hypothetical protein
MKRYMITTAVILGLAFAASAQEKLWTWNAPTNQKLLKLHAVSMGQDGSAGVVFGRVIDAIHVEYVIYWIASNGKVIMKDAVKTSDTSAAVSTWSESMGWNAAVASPRKLIISTRKDVRVYTLKNDGSTELKTTKQEDAIMFTYSKFTGWLQPTGPTNRHHIEGDPYGNTTALVQNIESLVAWKP